MKQNRVISGAVAALVLAALLAGCGSTATGASSADSTPAATEAAGSEATAPTAEPQTEAALPDGVYTAEFETDSSMVHANEACDSKGTLTVADGKMTFHVSLASKKIVNLYLGTAEDAPSHESDWLQPTTDTVTYSDGTSDEVYGYDIEVKDALTAEALKELTERKRNVILLSYSFASFFVRNPRFLCCFVVPSRFLMRHCTVHVLSSL